MNLFSICSTSSNCDTLTSDFKVTIKNIRNYKVSGTKTTFSFNELNFLGFSMTNLLVS